MSMRILHDPANGELTGVITCRPESPTIVNWRIHDGRRCGRCGRELRLHVWQLVDTDPADAILAGQRGVVDCG